jgi:hypothetical protein
MNAQGDDVFTPQGPDCRDNVIENVVVWKTGGNIFGTGVETDLGQGNVYRDIYIVNSECCNLLTSNWSNGFFNIPEMRLENVILDDIGHIQSLIYFPGSNTGTRVFVFKNLLTPYAPSTVNTRGFTFTFENSYMEGKPIAHFSDLDVSTVSGNAFIFRVGWQPVSVRDFNADGRPDIVWRNQDSGQNHFWFLDGTTKVGTADTDFVLGNTWRMITTADMNNDGKPDIIWRNLSSGQNHVWFMDGTRKNGTADMENVAGTSWKLIAAADMNGDGKPDLVWRNPYTGQNHVWFMNGTTKTGTADLEGVYGRDWKLITVADINRDTRPDLIWRNTVTGQNHVWYMDGVSKTGTAGMPYVMGTEWIMVGEADINRDGWNDIIWRHVNSGQNHVWYMNGVNRVGTGDFERVIPVGG